MSPIPSTLRMVRRFWIVPVAVMAVWFNSTVAVRGSGPHDSRPSTVHGTVDTVALRRAVVDLSESFGSRYARGPEFLVRLDELDRQRVAGVAVEQLADGLETLRREALSANPLLDFERLLLVKRPVRSPRLGLPMNWQGNGSLPRTGFADEIAILSPVRPDGRLTTVYRPQPAAFVGDVDLHFTAERLLFSALGSNNRWQVFELKLTDGGVRQVTPSRENDVDNYDACYLPSGDIIFSSTACFQGVPCVTGADHVANLYLLDDRGGRVRQLTFDQDHDWCPTVMENGRVLYLRWEYADLPHFVSRILFHMNPDGTDQAEFYGSSSYWPNSMFYARPIPHHPTKFIAVISGHHDVPRMGELVLFDVARGHQEADGVLQRIPGFGRRVEPVLRDELVQSSWPKFLHPWPLSDKYFLVSAQPSADANWGIYLVDVFDNMLLLKESPGDALLEPIPYRPTPNPPVIPSRVQPERTDATVYLEDIYTGPGLAGVPRGTVKKLRLFTYHFAYHGMGGQVNRVGLDGPWDVKQILGTVPVEADGSAAFHIPANTPVSVQPLDSEGKALQLMRSWFVGMPGEQVSCVGCHAGHHRGSTNARTIALTKPPASIAPWYGPTRGFSFDREIQPLLDRHCVECHGGQLGGSGVTLPDFRRAASVHPAAAGRHYNLGTKFSPSYLALRCFVRSPSIESDMHLLMPLEFHADTTRLVRTLREGHHGVELDEESWDQLITWIDLGAPAHGTWREIVGDDLVRPQYERRRAMLRLYAGRDEDPERFDMPREAAATGTAVHELPSHHSLPLLEQAAARDQPSTSAPKAGGVPLASWVTRHVDLGGGVKLELVRIPPGSFHAGATNGTPRERTEPTDHIDRPFWMGRYEITNEQFQRFDSAHDSRLEDGDFLQFGHADRGYTANEPRQPVCRVSWERAVAFCDWLSQVTSEKFTLPSEVQWEYACRAGTTGALWYGDVDDDFSAAANLADTTLRTIDSFEPWKLPAGAIPPWRPAEVRFNDGYRVAGPVGSFRPNPWGLYDMHGNVAEWTCSDFESTRRVVRGGSWYDRPVHARSDHRTSYRPYQPVFDVGFRVVCEAVVQPPGS